MATTRKGKSRTKKTDVLDRALDAWREETPAQDTMSDAGRANLFRAVASPHAGSVPPRRLESLFLPVRRWALTAAVPAILAAVLIPWVVIEVRTPGSGTQGSVVSVEALKVGDRVVFTIANGGRPHRVVRASSPHGSASGESLPVEQGTFSDRLQDGSDLVFYRID